MESRDSGLWSMSPGTRTPERTFFTLYRYKFVSRMLDVPPEVPMQPVPRQTIPLRECATEVPRVRRRLAWRGRIKRLFTRN